MYRSIFDPKKEIEHSVQRRTTGWTDGVRFSIGARDFCHLYSVLTSSGAYLASYPEDAAGSFPAAKRPEREADHSSPSSAVVKNDEAVLHAPIRLHSVVLN
jgi:hypothetical protein